MVCSRHEGVISLAFCSSSDERVDERSSPKG